MWRGDARRRDASLSATGSACGGRRAPVHVIAAVARVIDGGSEADYFALIDQLPQLRLIELEARSGRRRLLHLLEGLSHHLTAAVVSRDPDFTSRVLMRTTNGTTYAGIRARTTGAPQNHWFGPGSDPRGAGIGTIEAIRSVWSYHREIISDVGPTWTDADQKFIQS